MAKYVHSGEKIQASQYNELVDAIAGPTNATTDQPFTQTSNGIVINNGRNTTQTQADSTTEPLFNISYGIDKLPDFFEGGENYFDGIWAKLTSWDKLDNICYHTYMLGWPVYLFLIDDTASSGKLIWSSGDELASSTGNLLLPLCKVSESAGVATFTIKNESASASLLQQMQTVVVIGNFQKLGCQLGELAIDINKTSLTNLVRSACPLLNEITGLALRDSRPLYVAPDEDFAANAQPVTYKVGQIECETLPDSFQGPGGWVGYDIHLSSLAFTPSKQIGANDPTIPTFSQGLFNFDRFSADYNTLSAMQHAQHVDGSGAGDEQLSTFDVLVRHKAPHPLANAGVPAYEGQAMAKLEYVSLSALLSGNITAGGISGDVNVYPFMEKSIETLSGELGKFHRLYNWMNYSADQSHVISAAFGETRYFPFQDGIGAATDLASAAHILTRPRVGARDLHYDAYGIRIPKVSPTDITNELYELILSGGTDLCAIRQIIINTLDDADAKEPLSSNLDDCFWPQGGDRSNCYGSGIGNSIKEQVIDLDGTILKATGNNGSNLDWSTGICRDSDGEQSITWDGRGLIDSNGVWAIDWDGRQGYDSSNNVTIDWENKQLKGNWSVDQGNFTIGNGYLQIGSTTITEAQLQQLLALLNP